MKLTCPLKRLTSFFLLVADPVILCGEKAVISKIMLLLAAGVPVVGVSNVCWKEG